MASFKSSNIWAVKKSAADLVQSHIRLWDGSEKEANILTCCFEEFYFAVYKRWQNTVGNKLMGQGFWLQHMMK